MKQNIAVFVKNLTSGGAEKQSVLLAKALAGNYRMHYIIFNADKVHEKYMEMLRESPDIRIASFKGTHLRRYRDFVSYLKDNDIRFIFSYLTAANLYACLAAKSLGIRVFTGLRNSELPKGKLMAERWLTNRMAYMSVANCFSGKENFVRKGFNADRIEVIPNCFEHITPYSPPLDHKDIRIITVGRFVPQKDYETAIRAITEVRKHTRNISFRIVGYGSLETHIRKWVKDYGIEDITEIHINPGNIPELLDNADIYLSTSLFEGTSNSIMEGMNANLPIVATRVGDNPYLVTSENGFIADKQDVRSLADFLSRLVNDRELREKMGKASKQLLLDNYSMDIFRKNYIRLFDGR